MKKTQRFFALILCVIMLLPILGCGQNKPQPSQTVQESAPAPESSKPSGPVYDTEPPVMESEEEIIDYTKREPAYSIEPLKEPKNGAMTYEEFFSEERFVEMLEDVFIDDIPDEIKNNSNWLFHFEDKSTKPYVVDVGDGYIVPLNWSEIWWYNYDFSEKLLLRRAAEGDILSGLSAYENILVWHERNNTTTTTYRLYLPTMETERIADHILVPLAVTKDYGHTYEGFSTDTFDLYNFFHFGGMMVYCHSDDTFYFVKVKDQMNGWDLWPNLQEMKEKLNG